MEIGFLIKRHRQEKNLTLREFAAKCGTSHSYIAMLENGKNSKTGEPIVPSISMLRKISLGMGISINELIAMCDDMPITLNDNTPTKLNLQLFAEENPTAISDGVTGKRKELIDYAITLSEEQADRALQVLKLIVEGR